MSGSPSIPAPRVPAVRPDDARSPEGPDSHQVELHNPELIRAKGELERSRARYFELFDFAPVAYLTFSRQGRIESLNLAAAELLEVDRARVSGVGFDTLLDESSKAVFAQHLAQVFDQPAKHAHDLILAPDRNGLRRHIHLVSRMIHRELGDAPLSLSAAIDITARKLAEDEISHLNSQLEHRVEQRTRELEELNKDLESFIYSISHDLRAPLRNMAGFATIISEDFADKIPEEVNGFAKRILASNEKMLHLVDDLLRFSRLGRKPLDVTRTDLNELVDEALSELSSEMVGREIEWDRKPLPVAECDRGLMRQVFVNVLSNALKYSRPRKPAVIRIGCEVRDAVRVIYVQDNGVGFDMRYYDKLFGVFQRLHVPSEFEGTGVGLAMVSRILHRHGGRAHAEGRVGAGAKFWFTFEGLKNAP